MFVRGRALLAQSGALGRLEEAADAMARTVQRNVQLSAEHLAAAGFPLLAERVRRSKGACTIRDSTVDTAALRGPNILFGEAASFVMRGFLEKTLELGERVWMASDAYGPALSAGLLCVVSPRVRIWNGTLCFVPYAHTNVQRAIDLLIGTVAGERYFYGPPSQFTDVVEATLRLGGIDALRSLFGMKP